MSKIDKLLLLLFVVVGIVLRFYRFDAAIGWWGDAARDYLVSYHLAEFNEALMVGHFATGISNGFYHPPYYYYFISFLIRIFESPLFATGFFTFFHSLSTLAMYGIGKELYDKRVGLLSAGLFSISA
ncbi:MAG: glycosyltransferase family 39 protein, partial [Patescibacteria group bacterium]